MRLGWTLLRVYREVVPMETIEASAGYDKSHHASEEMVLIKVDNAPQISQEIDQLEGIDPLKETRRRPGSPPSTGKRFLEYRYTDSHIATCQRPTDPVPFPADQLTQLRIQMESADYG